jgi:mRNA interferase HigB
MSLVLFPIKDKIMHVISRKKLIACWTIHPDTEDPLKAWEKETEHSEWGCFEDIKKVFGSASKIKGNRVVFNIKGNKYRLLVKIDYSSHIVFIRFIGTHEEYDMVSVEII